MGLLNSALHIGRSAILGYEAALHVVGNNISSAASPDFTRLSPQLDPLQGPLLGRDLQPGAGVALTAIQRNLDEALEARIRLAIAAAASMRTQEAGLAQIETLFDDFGGLGMATQITEFFNRFDELGNNPEDVAIRDLIIGDGVRLAESLRRVRGELLAYRGAVDEQIATLVDHGNDLTTEIARLNSLITTAEAGRRGQATGLRDQRDALLRRLSDLYDVTVRRQPDGTVNVYIGNEAVVQGGSVRELTTVPETDGEQSRLSVRFADTNQQVAVRGGALHGLIVSRDVSAPLQSVDRLAAALIAEVNRVHADGQGLSGFTTATGTYDVLRTDAALDSAAAGLPFPPKSGSFLITVSDTATGTPVAHEIRVRLDGSPASTTLESLVAQINDTVTGVTASITPDNRLKLSADNGFTFTFGHDGQDARADTSGVLAALGINTFFTGRDAGDIAVNDTLTQGPSLLAAASVFISGDGGNAARIAELSTAQSSRLAGASIPTFYRAIAGSVANASASARQSSEAAQTVFSSLQTQREAISGVNLDEEAIALVKFERAYQGAARFMRTVNDLLAELVSVIR